MTPHVICLWTRLLLPCLLIPSRSLPLQAQPLEARERPSLPSLRLHFSERAALLHLIDTLSQWSPYCTRVDHGFLGIPELAESDRLCLQRYAAARRPMGYAAETGLFLWAESGFPLEGRASGYEELKAALGHFQEDRRFRDPSSRRMSELERFRPLLEQEVDRLQTRMQSLQGVVGVLRTEEMTGTKEVPLFIMYTLDPHASQGGANGEGLFTSVDPSDRSGDMLPATQILHEYLHLALRPRERFEAFAASDPHSTAWQQALSSVPPDERGDSEACMLDEILVYALANVVVGSRDPETEMRAYASRGDKQMVRMWDGVRVLLPIIRVQLANPQSSREFLSQLIGSFVERVHYRAWSCPKGFTIAAKAD